jgi:hypothetical protein
LGKSPSGRRLREEGGGSSWGSGWRNSDHHPEALFFRRIGHVPGKFAEGDHFARFSPRSDLPPGLSLRNIGRGFIEREEPAEPDDPNSATLNSNVYKNLGVGKNLFPESASVLKDCLSHGAGTWRGLPFLDGWDRRGL